METWALFTGTDIALAFVGLAGFVSVGIVLATANGNVAKREFARRKNG